MSDGIGSVRTLKRKNVKGLALAAPAPRTVAPSESDLQIPGGIGNENPRQTAQLEIGIEYKLDLKREDLEVLKDLGHGNGGTVSKVRHMATGTIMARKVCNLEGISSSKLLFAGLSNANHTPPLRGCCFYPPTPLWFTD
jgi:mitogen-activated protein kinase kinase